MTEKRFHINQDNLDLDRLVDCEHEWITHENFNTDNGVICRKCNLRATYWVGTVKVGNAAPQGVITFEEQEK